MFKTILSSTESCPSNPSSNSLYFRLLALHSTVCTVPSSLSGGPSLSLSVGGVFPLVLLLAPCLVVNGPHHTRRKFPALCSQADDLLAWAGWHAAEAAAAGPPAERTPSSPYVLNSRESLHLSCLSSLLGSSSLSSSRSSACASYRFSLALYPSDVLSLHLLTLAMSVSPPSAFEQLQSLRACYSSVQRFTNPSHLSPASSVSPVATSRTSLGLSLLSLLLVSASPSGAVPADLVEVLCKTSLAADANVEPLVVAALGSLFEKSGRHSEGLTLLSTYDAKLGRATLLDADAHAYARAAAANIEGRGMAGANVATRMWDEAFRPSSESSSGRGRGCVY